MKKINITLGDGTFISAILVREYKGSSLCFVEHNDKRLMVMIDDNNEEIAKQDITLPIVDGIASV